MSIRVLSFVSLFFFLSVVYSRTLDQCLRECDRSSFAKYQVCAEACWKVAGPADDDLSAPKTQIDSSAAWNKYRDTLVSALLGSATAQSNIQVLTVPFEAEWDEVPGQLETICDAVPFTSGFYEPSGYSIRQQYRDFVNNINRARDGQIVSASDKAELDKWTNIFNQESNNLFPAQMECALKFKAANNPGTFAQFERTCTKFQDVKKKIDDANIWMEYHSAQAFGVEFADLVKSRSQSKAVESMKFREFGTSLADFKNSVKRGESSSLRVEFSLTAGDRKNESYDHYVQGMKRPSSLGGSMFSLLAGPSATGLTTTMDKFKMNIYFKAWKRINISPGDWFSANTVQQFKNGPFIHPQRNLFGVGGSMTLIPKAIYVAVQPSVEMIVNKSDEFRLNKSVSEGKGGLFSSKSVTAEINTQYLSEDTYKVTIRSNSKVPQVIAFDFTQL